MLKLIAYFQKVRLFFPGNIHRAKKRVPTRRPQLLTVLKQPNQVWSTVFMSDALCRGSRFRMINVLDDINREALAIEIDISLTSGRLVKVFEQLKDERNLPHLLRTDNGPEFLDAETPFSVSDDSAPAPLEKFVHFHLFYFFARPPRPGGGRGGT